MGGLRIAAFPAEAGRRVSQPRRRRALVSWRVWWFRSSYVDGAAVTERRKTPAFQSVLRARAGFEKQRLSAFSRRGPSFWPLDRCHPARSGARSAHWRRRRR